MEVGIQSMHSVPTRAGTLVIGHPAGLLVALPLLLLALLGGWPADRGNAVVTAAAANGAPAPRSSPVTFYDPVGQRLIAFGGISGAPGARTDDLWAYALAGPGGWTRLAPAGEAPAIQPSAPPVYDRANQRVLIYAATTVGAVGVISLTEPLTWTVVMPTGTPPPPRSNASAIYDPAGQRLIVFGGQNGGSSADRLNDTWALSLVGAPTWTELAIDGVKPYPRAGHLAGYDVEHRRMVVAGGAGSGDREWLWALSLDGTPAWTELPVENPGVASAPGVYDPVDRQFLYVPTYTSVVRSLKLTDPARNLTLGTVSPPPRAQRGWNVAYDSDRRQVVVFGGIYTVPFGDANITPTPTLMSAMPAVSRPHLAPGHPVDFYVNDTWAFGPVRGNCQGYTTWLWPAPAMPTPPASPGPFRFALPAVASGWCGE